MTSPENPGYGSLSDDPLSLSTGARAYLITDPLALPGELNSTKAVNLRKFISQQAGGLNDPTVRVEPIECNIAAWAGVELAYRDIINAEEKPHTSQNAAHRQLTGKMRLANRFFGAVDAAAKENPDYFDNEETYYSALGGTMIKFAAPLTPAEFSNAVAGQYKRGVVSLALAHGHFLKARDRQDTRVGAALARLRAQLLGMTCLMRHNQQSGEPLQLLALPPFTRQQKAVQNKGGRADNRWNISIWRGDVCRAAGFSLRVPPDLRWRIHQGRPDPLQSEAAINLVSLRDDVVNPLYMDLLVTTALQEVSKTEMRVDPQGKKLLDEASANIHTLALTHLIEKERQ